MAYIEVAKRWNEETQDYEPDQYILSGIGNVEVSYQFMRDADPRYVRMVDQIIYIGPFELEVIAQSRNTNGTYLCKIVKHPNATPQKPRIENARQYQVTLDAARKFRIALEALESENAELLHPLLAQARLESVRSVLSELEADLAAYENSKNNA